MGYALIVGGGTDGRYTISLDIGEAERAALVATFGQRLADAQAKLAAAQIVVNAKAAELEAAALAYDAATEEYIQLLRGELGSVTVDEIQRIITGHSDAQRAYMEARAAHASALSNKNALSFSADRLQKALEGWQAQVLTETRGAWCADFTEDATGYVATMDIPGESDLILIAPGGRLPVLETDGYLRSRGLMAPWQAYFNACILPGWQKFKPTYRWGTITALDESADTATVALAEARSSAQRLLVNQADTLENVPVLYMDCNASAFEIGDRCVVEFVGQYWDYPRVIGFLDNPRACGQWSCYFGQWNGTVHPAETSYRFVAREASEFLLLLNAAIDNSAVVEMRINMGAWLTLTRDPPLSNSYILYYHPSSSLQGLFYMAIVSGGNTPPEPSSRVFIVCATGALGNDNVPELGTDSIVEFRASYADKTMNVACVFNSPLRTKTAGGIAILDGLGSDPVARLTYTLGA